MEIDGRIIAAILGAIIGSIIGPVIKNYLDRWTAKRNAKTELRPEVYETLVKYLFAEDLTNEDLEDLKIKLLVYGKDEVIKDFVKVLENKSEGKISIAHFRSLMIEIRSNLGMSSNFQEKEIESILRLNQHIATKNKNL
ncbi:MAG: hypothetical protein GQ574_07290 [Crocinitomix sp.]|nr:hypothetical protein [Crocinitomix sp.]